MAEGKNKIDFLDGLYNYFRSSVQSEHVISIDKKGENYGL